MNQDGYQKRPLRVLLVDDDENYALLVSTQIRREYRAEVRIFNDALVAIEHLKHNQSYDVAILDYNIGNVTGDALEFEMRKLPHLRGIPIIVATGDEWNVAHYRRQRRGATHVMTKKIFQEQRKQVLDDILAA